ncbi:hypothetical protein N7454_010732 [Penicillium verhagenii]|nr:hypothetical protein N7454_010732 [Penicillium verhagenii]
MSASRDSPMLPKLEFKEYHEAEDFKAQRMDSNSRFQTVIYRSHDKKWWVKITVEGAIPCSSCDIRPEQIINSRRKRREELQDFVKRIEFQSLALLDDTVTEIVFNEVTRKIDRAKLCLEPEATDQQPPPLIGTMRCYIREDPMRVKYPPAAQFPSFRAIKTSDLIREIEITSGVFRVLHRFENTRYIFKVVNCSHYIPHDTEVIKQELENLEQFKGARGIVQAAGIAVFINPYTTCQEGSHQMVINGILLDFYSGGTLSNVLKEKCISHLPWRSWGIQIGCALDTIHRAKKTHMDLKTANIVLDKDGNAIIIDISGIGGITYGWQAPEMLGEPSPLGLPFHSRQLNDVWAFGKVLQQIASKVEDCAFKRTLDIVADHLMDYYPNKRWTLSEALSHLRIHD